MLKNHKERKRSPEEDPKMSEEPVPGYLYVIQEREFVRSDEDVYKVGRTYNVAQRLSQYPRGSDLIAALPVLDMV